MIQSIEIIHHAFNGEAFADEFPATAAKAVAQGGVARKLSESLCQRREVAGFDEEAGFIVEADFAGAIAIVGDDRTGGSESLGQGPGQAFTQREMHEHVHDTDETGDIGRRDQTSKDETIFKFERAGAIEETFSPRAITDEEEFEFGEFLDQCWSDGKQVIVALEFEEAGDVADDDVVRSDLPARANRRIVGGRQERGQREAAEDFSVLGRLADAGGKILACHGVGDGDEMGGDFAGAAFSGAKKSVGQRALKRAEGRAVDGVDNDGDGGTMSGEASEKTRLAAVSVDNVGTELAEETSEFAPGKQVFPRMDGADQFRQEPEGLRRSGEGGFKRAFGAGSGAGNQVDVESRFLLETKNGGDGIFLSAADDKPGNDVKDAHPSRRAVV